MTASPSRFHYSFYYIALASGFSAAIFILNNFLIHLLGWQGVFVTLSGMGILSGDEADSVTFTGLVQTAAFLAAVLMPIYMTQKARKGAFLDYLAFHEKRFSTYASFVISFAFWGVMLVGITDAVISFMRIEGTLVSVFGQELASDLGRSVWRGSFVHMPLLGIAALIALRFRGISFIWLATLIVVAELLIVVARFIFSYEQAFMGDLVRFWYAALFLFASAQTLVEEGHVRVDVIYAGLSEVKKAFTNVVGAVALGIPLCWVILSRGLWENTSVINGALLKFETSQSGFGMYVKYLMAGFLIIFAFSMILQFSAFIMSHLQNHIKESQNAEN